jgi:hypothetical protein
MDIEKSGCCEEGAADTSMIIPTKDLDAERKHLALLHDFSDHASNFKGIESKVQASAARPKGRRPKAGRYPTNFSPYSMCAANGGMAVPWTIPLARGLTKMDLKVCPKIPRATRTKQELWI